MNSVTYPTGRTVGYGVAGGFAGAIVLGAIAYMMPINGVPFFVAAAMLMGLGANATAGGWMLHLITGVIVGAIFGVVLAKVSKFQPRSKGRTAGLGLTAGIVVWVVFFIPLMASLMPALMSNGLLIGGSFVGHAIFGLVLGGVVGLAITRGTYKCDTCGASFDSKEELMEHSEVHLKAQGQFKCPTCGATFGSQAELMEHNRKAHPMP